MKKCNVLFVSHVASKKYGGAERVLDDLLCHLDRDRYKSILLLQDTLDKETNLDWDCASIADIEHYDFGPLKHRSKLVAIAGMMFRIIKALFYIPALIKKHNVDIICANTPIAAAFSALPSRLLGKRFIYYEHNLADQRKGHIIGLALKPVAFFATDIICISKSVKDNLVREGVSETKLHLIYNGYDFGGLIDSSNSDEELPERHQHNVLRVGMIANFMPWKRHQVFLDLIDRLSKAVPHIRIEAVIVGGCLPGNENYHQQIVNWVNNYDGQAHFELTGFKTNAPDYLRSFDVLINPAKAEPFGLVFIEAMYLGCVVIGSDGGAAPEIIEDGITGYITDFDNREDALRKLVELSSDLPTRLNVARRAPLAVQERFSIETYVSQVEELFESTC